MADSFEAVTQPTNFTPLPDDWYVGAADIVGSTELISAGRYKLVNMIGAAVISAQRNAIQSEASAHDFPFVFGGDGAVFACWSARKDAATEALAAVARWADEEFGIELRIAMAPVSTIRAEGHDVRVARLRTGRGAQYAMFDGGGASYLETEMKQGRFQIAKAARGTIPDLTGLSCRWTPMRATRGQILSLIVRPGETADARHVQSLYKDLHNIVAQLDRSGHPIPLEGPGYRWPPEGLELEARATHGRSSVFKRKMGLLLETFIAWVFYRFKLRAGRFDAREYGRVTGQNADYRKLSDGLMMTIDCDARVRMELSERLESAQSQGLVRYGMHAQDEAILTCIVPSVIEHDHLHFVDGATGGYATAASRIKEDLAPEARQS